MSTKKKKESKKGTAGAAGGAAWPSPGSGAAAAPLPEPAKSRLWELFGAIEREFELLHADNAARKPIPKPTANNSLATLATVVLPRTSDFVHLKALETPL